MTSVLQDRAAAAATTSRDRLALGVLVSAQFLVMLDASIVNVALPSIQSELGFGPASVTWVVNAYVLAFAGLLLLSGRAADLFGRRRVFTVGASLFILGTLLAAASVGPEMLVAGRVVQGIGAAGLSPAAMSLLLATFPAAQRARAMGAWGAASTLGGATGVVSGGVLAGTVGWRAVFLVTVPVSLAAAASARRLLAEDAPGVRRTVDWVGAALVTGAVIALVHGAVDAVDPAWTSPRVLGPFAVSAVILVAFVRVERQVRDPLVPLDLFASRTLRLGTGL
ncbi:MAG TPA: MFS transporter, partial [Nocardioides sp.]